MPARSGPIQAAINLEIPEGNIKYFNVKIEGLNGQLPNLDLVNLVVRLCKRHSVDVGLHHRVSQCLMKVTEKSNQGCHQYLLLGIVHG